MNSQGYNCLESTKIALFKNYSDFSGRSRRRDFWFYILFLIIMAYFYFYIFLFLTDFCRFEPDFVISLLVLIALILLFPLISLTVRRLHDTGKSGFYIFIQLLPIIGTLILLVALLEDSKNDNIYGPSPKYNNNIVANQGNNYIPPQNNMIIQGNNVNIPQNNLPYNQGNIIYNPNSNYNNDGKGNDISVSLMNVAHGNAVIPQGETLVNQVSDVYPSQ